MVKKINYWLYAFILVHVTIWTLTPSLIRFTLPLDAMEGTTWGHQLEWGYDKNPFMNGWLTALAVKLGGQSGWMVYLFSQLSVALCFWAVWRLGKQMVPPLYALLSVLLLEGIQYYNFHAIDFNDNTLELGFWAVTILCFYNAIHQKNLTQWILTGLFAGISMMTKYYVAVLLLPMFMYLIIDKDARENLFHYPLYVGIAVFLLFITPHTIWLFHHDFITINYAFDRVSSPPEWWVHLYFPVQFTWQMFDTFLPAGLLFTLLITGRFFKDVIETPDSHQPIDHNILDHEEHLIDIKKSDKRFLLFMGFGPFILTVLLSAFAGIKLRAGWGQPLLSLWGLILLAYLRPAVTPKQFYRFISVLFIILCVAIAAYCVAFTRAKKPSSANFPGQTIAATLTEQWHQQFHTPLTYVAGARWLAGNIAFYSHDKPTVYIDWDNSVSTWIDEKKLKKAGAVFVWDLFENDNIPYNIIKKRFPHLSKPQVLRFAWMRNPNMAPIRIKVAYLPPEHPSPAA